MTKDLERIITKRYIELRKIDKIEDLQVCRDKAIDGIDADLIDNSIFEKLDKVIDGDCDCQNINDSECVELIQDKVATIGEVREWQGGKYKKLASGEWEKVGEEKGNKTEEKEDITETKEFKEWFGDSKVVDDKGKPLVVYHGSPNKFEKFDKKKLGSNTGKTITNLSGFFFSDNQKVADSFKGKQLENGNLIQGFIKINNPYFIDAKNKDYSQMKHILNDKIENLDKNKYDGIFIKNYKDSNDNNPLISNQFIIFYPTQIIY